VNGTDETAIRRLLDALTDAWNRGDAEAFSARYRDDGTFTNVFGTLHFGKEAFRRRHEEVFGGFLKGTRIAMTTRTLRFLRPDVAVIDLDVAYSDVRSWPPGVRPASPGELQASLLMVLVKDGGDWWVAAYHNIWQTAPN
jgi:uncharacterized protein (TIGR02246 family)